MRNDNDWRLLLNKFSRICCDASARSDNAGWAFSDSKEGLPDDEDDDDIKKMGDDEPSKTAIILCVVCCCVIILGTVGAVLGAVVFKKEDDTKSPTMSPTAGPTASPTPLPTPVASASPTDSQVPTEGLPSEVIVTVAGDTSLRDGNFSGATFGDEDVLLVKNDPNATFSSRALLRFDLGDFPFPHSNIFDTPKSATLVLEHVVGIAEGLGTAITLVKLPSIPLAVETLSWDIYQPTGGVDWTVFRVEDEPEILVDITDLFFDLQEQQRQRQRRMLRGLQDAGTLMLMLEARGANNGDNGVEFRSQEFNNGEKAPKIVVKYPTRAPTLSPSVSPTTSQSPSSSHPPSNVPTSSSAPTTTPMPTITPSISPTDSEDSVDPCIPLVVNGTMTNETMANATNSSIPFCDETSGDSDDKDDADSGDSPDTPTNSTNTTNTTRFF